MRALRDAYQQLEVAEDSQEYLTINTHIGLYRFKRLAFGVACAPTQFQSVMDRVIRGLDKTVCFIDDVLIGGSTVQECKNNLINVMRRFKDHNVRINIEKCQLFETSVIYLGHEISGEGIKPNKKKLDALVHAPKPTNLIQLKSYLGLLNYYGKCIPNLSAELCDLYALTRKDTPFVWTEKCQIAFDRSKNLILGSKILAHYDPSKDIVVQCDASPYGLGAILSHVVGEQEHPVLFASCSLTNAQKNYSQLHREARAVVFAVKKFHKYFLVRKKI